MATKWAAWLGLLIVVGTHVPMLFAPLPENQMVIHAWANLIAVLLIGFAWMNKK